MTRRFADLHAGLHTGLHYRRILDNLNQVPLWATVIQLRVLGAVSWAWMLFEQSTVVLSEIIDAGFEG